MKLLPKILADEDGEDSPAVALDEVESETQLQPLRWAWTAALVAGAATPYAGYALAVQPDRSDITYALARFGGVEGKHLVSQMYDPFAYLPAGYRYEDHTATVNTLLQCWLSETNIRMIAIEDKDANLGLAQRLNPSWFVSIGFMDEAKWKIEGVSVPRPSTADCKAARSAIR